MAPGCLSCHSFISSPTFQSMCPFEVLPSWFRLGESKIVKKRRGGIIRMRAHEKEKVQNERVQYVL